MPLRRLRDFSLASRFSMLLGLSIGFSILITTAVFVWYELMQGHQQQENGGIALAEVAAWNSSAALAFGDAKAAQPVLASLGTQAGVIAVYIQYPDGRIFSRFESAGVAVADKDVAQDSARLGAVFAIPREPLQRVMSQGKPLTLSVGSYLHILAPVFVDKEIQGVVHVVNDQRLLHDKQLDLLRIVGLLLIVVLAVAWLLVLWARRSFLVPIQRLADTIREVTEGHDYSARVIKLGNDELGELSDSFNALLIKLQNRDRSLARYRAELEDAVDQRTAELSESNLALSTANEELQFSNQSLEDARNVAESADRAKMAFLANMSHEIRTPMNAVYGLADLLGMTSLDDIQQSYLRDLKMAASTLLELIDDVLDIAKIEANSLRLSRAPFQVTQLLDRVRTVVGNQALTKRLDFSIECDSDIAKFMLGDRVRLTQVLINLCGNAVKFTSQGYVSLELQKVSERDGVIGVRFMVTDTGIGIDAGDLDGLFDAFNQADGSITRRFGGTGLGLTICRHLVERMGGEIVVESELGKGSCFSFEVEFPIANDDQQEKGRNQANVLDSVGTSSPIKDLSGLHLLLVEDVFLNQHVMKALLESKGARVSVADDGQQALDVLQGVDTIDLVFMDLRMPVLDGFSATKQIHNNKSKSIRTTPVVALTADATSHEKARCFEVGMDAYLSKPVELDDLCQVVCDLLPQGKRNLSAAKSSSLEHNQSPRPADKYDVSTFRSDDAMSAEGLAFPDLPWVDQLSATQAVDGSLQLYRVALSSAKELMPQMLEEFINTAGGSEKPNEQGLLQIGESAHRFIGPLGSLGAVQLVKKARLLEKRCLHPELADQPLQWPADFEALLLPLQDLVNALLQLSDGILLCESSGASADATADARGQSGYTDVLEQLLQLRDFAKNHRFEALEMSERLSVHPALGDYRVLTDSLYLSMKRFKFSDGLDTLNRLIEAVEEDCARDLSLSLE